MSKISRFFRTVLSTIYDPAFYARVQTEGLAKPIKMTALLGALGALLLMVLTYAALTTLANPAVLNTVASLYPDDLVVTLKNGEMSINQPEPYSIPNTINPGGPKKLVIFDTGDTLQGGAAQNDTYVLVKKTYAITQQQGSERKTYFSEHATSTPVSLTKGDVTKFFDSIRPYMRPVVLIGGLFAVALGGILLAAAWLGAHLLYLLIPALIIFMYGKFRVPQLSWKESYITAVYASIPVAIATYLLHFAGFTWPIFFYTLLVMLVTLINLTQIPNGVPALQKPKE